MSSTNMGTPFCGTVATLVVNWEEDRGDGQFVGNEASFAGAKGVLAGSFRVDRNI